ncbi:hypothetical protein CC80DRAFT_530449 [Byssothecium circinans]|uniref:Uncharacterized protein n=1 Tax=Byssothecium circinans TaxID=147558 RepID=A0A6A5URD3_9PLEO|nr:hypothetical protein CC80DRAFT_530449 [Byssothecium circinans]
MSEKESITSHPTHSSQDSTPAVDLRATGSSCLAVFKSKPRYRVPKPDLILESNTNPTDQALEAFLFSQLTAGTTISELMRKLQPDHQDGEREIKPEVRVLIRRRQRQSVTEKALVEFLYQRIDKWPGRVMRMGWGGKVRRNGGCEAAAWALHQWADGAGHGDGVDKGLLEVLRRFRWKRWGCWHGSE